MTQMAPMSAEVICVICSSSVPSADQGGYIVGVRNTGAEETSTGFYLRNAFGKAESGSTFASSLETHLGVGFAGAGTPTSAAGGYVYLRNRWYDPGTGRFLSQDPIGLAGGVNLYAYAGNNPTSYSDPFGLCAGGDTLTIKVTAYCPGSTTPIEVEVKAVRVSDQAQLGQLSKVAGGLQGGNSIYTASAVSAAVQAASNSGEVYIFPSKTADGADVATGGETDGNRLRFRSDVWSNIQKGSHFMNRQTNPRFQGTSCRVLGHEGVHLVQHANGRSNGDPLNEPEATRTNSTWTCH